jgi:hypothetical protein
MLFDKMVVSITGKRKNSLTLKYNGDRLEIRLQGFPKPLHTIRENTPVDQQRVFVTEVLARMGEPATPARIDAILALIAPMLKEHCE